MKFGVSSVLLLTSLAAAPVRTRAAACLAASGLAAEFTAGACAPGPVEDAVAAALAADPACAGATTPAAELAALLGLDGADDAAVDAELRARCADAVAAAVRPFGKVTRRGDAFDREFFAGGSDWNDQHETSDGRHVLATDAARIQFEAAAATTAPLAFPSHLPAFADCRAGAAMCCHVADRQAGDAAGRCDAAARPCRDADPRNNTDVCVASMADAPVSARVRRGLAVYHLNEGVAPAEGPVNCHGFAWDSADGESASAKYRGNVLFDVAFKQSLYDKGYVKNVPGAPMCGCIEQMPTVTRAHCTKVTSVSETYSLSTDAEGALRLELSASDVRYGPCDDGEDLASHYKAVNAANDPAAIDSKLVGDGNCLATIDAAMAGAPYGYKRSTLTVVDATFAPPDAAPPTVRVAFSAPVSDDGAAADAFAVHEAADPSQSLPIDAAVLTRGGGAVELALAASPDTGVAYTVRSVERLHKRVANMVVLEPQSPDDALPVEQAGWDHLVIGTAWRLGRVCDECAQSHLSVASARDEAGWWTAQIFRDTGSVHPGPREDYSAWDVGGVTGPTYSVRGVVFGDAAVQIRDWRIRQIDALHLSVTHQNGNVARIYRSDGTVHGNVPAFSGYEKPLGEPICAYLAENYLQVGDWRFAAYDDAHLSVAHRLGMTAAIYRTDGTVHFNSSGRRDYNGWALPEEDAVMGTKEGCEPLDPAEPNVLQIGSDWKLAQMYDSNHLSFSAKQAGADSLGGSLTAMVYRGHDGRPFSGPRSDYNAWDEVPTNSDVGPQFGDKTLQIDKWRIRQVDDNHLSISQKDAGISARIYRSDGEAFSAHTGGYSAWRDPDIGDTICAFLTDKFLQLGDWRMGEVDAQHFSVGHVGGMTALIYRRDGTVHPGQRTSYNPWQFDIGTILQGSTNGCAHMLDSTLEVSSGKVVVKFNRDMSIPLPSYFAVRSADDPSSELAISSTALKDGDSSSVEIILADIPSTNNTYRVSTIEDVPTSDPMVVIPAGTTHDVTFLSWDYLQIANWRIARTCETCSNSHFSISSENIMTSQIFRDTGSTHRGPRSDYNGWDTSTSTGPTHSSLGVTFGNMAVQVRDWRIRQIDATHLSVTHQNGNVARIYRSDGTVHGNVRDFSGYKAALGTPTCTYLSERYLQVGDWRFGAINHNHFSVTHKVGKTAMIYRNDGTIHGGPRSDYNAWSLPEGETLMGTKDGCASLFT